MAVRGTRPLIVVEGDTVALQTFPSSFLQALKEAPRDKGPRPQAAQHAQAARQAGQEQGVLHAPGRCAAGEQLGSGSDAPRSDDVAH